MPGNAEVPPAEEYRIIATDDGRATFRLFSIGIEIKEEGLLEIYCGPSADQLQLIEAIPVYLAG